MNIDYEYYRVFYYVAICQNVTKAAEILQSTQPNVTRVIKKLESELNATLFYRTNRGMTLTPWGERLYSEVAVAVQHIENGQNAIFNNQQLENGELAICCTDISLDCYLLNVLKGFRSLYPNVKIKMNTFNTSDCISHLKSEMADFAIATTPIDSLNMLIAKELKHVYDVAVCADSFLKGEAKLSFEELLSYPIIVPNDKSSTFRVYDEFLCDHGYRLNPSIVVSNYKEVIRFVEAGFGIGFVPHEILDGYTNVREIEINEKLPKRTICLLKSIHHPYNIVAKTFEKYVLSYADLR